MQEQNESPDAPQGKEGHQEEEEGISGPRTPPWMGLPSRISAKGSYTPETTDRPSPAMPTHGQDLLRESLPEAAAAPAPASKESQGKGTGPGDLFCWGTADPDGLQGKGGRGSLLWGLTPSKAKRR